MRRHRMLRSRAEPPTRPDAGGCLADHCRNGPANLTRITISNSSLQDAFLPGALFVEANARGVDFSGAVPELSVPVPGVHARSHAPISRIGSILQNSDFRRANVERSSFAGATITDATFDFANVSLTDFTNAIGASKGSWFNIQGTPVGLVL